MNYKEIDQLVEIKDMTKVNDLVEAFTPLVIKTIMSYYKKQHLYDELVSEGKMIIIECFINYSKEIGAPFNAYLQSTLRFHYLAKNKKRECESLQKIVGDGQTIEDFIPAEEDVFQKIQKKEIYQNLYQAIDLLPRQQRLLIYYVYFKELSLQEVCHLLHIKKWTYYSTKRAALHELRKLLTKA